MGTTAISISRSTVSNNTYGIQLVNSTYCTISESNLTQNIYGTTITGSLCGNNTVNNCNISFNGIAITMVQSSNNNIIQNDIYDNTQYAFWIDMSENNQIYYNTLIGNAHQTYVIALSNKFDNGYPQGGNYWNDYSGTDQYTGPSQNQIGSDGIGDTPYRAGDNDNLDRYPYMKPPYEVDIAATDIFYSKTLVALNYTMRVYVRVINYGGQEQSFTITAYYNGTVLNSTNVVDMPGRSYMTATLLWRPVGIWTENYTHLVTAGNYTITASITELPNEANTTNNYCTGNTVRVCVLAGDLTNDGKVGPADFAAFARSYGSTPSKPLWTPNADFREDDKVGPDDFAIFSSNYGKHT